MLVTLQPREPEVIAGALLAGGGIGVGLGALLAVEARPTDGHVSMANSGGIWLGGLTLFGMLGVTGGRFSGQAFGTAELIASNAGMLTMALVGTQVQVSRGRMLLIDGGGILGTLVGMGIAVLASPMHYGPDASMLGWFSLLGAGAGLATTAVLTAGLDAPPRSVASRVTLSPMGPYGQPGLTAGLVF